MMNVTIENFETEVMAASATVPVLVDFWATWCGPCKVIGPILEKLELDYAGRFKLVKIDSDQEQQLAAAFGIRSIPTCVLLKEGRPVDGFMGALPEGQIRAFLDKHLPAPALVEPEPSEDLALAEQGQADPGAALLALEQALAKTPDNDDLRCDYVKALLLQGHNTEASQAFAPLAPKAALQRRVQMLEIILSALGAAAKLPKDALTGFEQKIAANRRDFDARYGRNQCLLAQRQWAAAMDELLEILMRDKSWNDELARKTYIAILELIEPPKVKVAEGQIPPEDATVASYRRRLSSVILS